MTSTKPLSPQTSEDGYNRLVQITENNNKSLSLIVGGVHCAMCIQKIESALKSHKAVSEARLNFSTGRLNIVWDGSEELANTFAATVKKLGYTVTPYNPDLEKQSDDKENRFLLLCLGVAGFAMGNIMLLSVGVWATSTESMGEATRGLMHLISALIAIPTVLFSGRPFFKSAYRALSNKQTNMDVPISLALILACGMSVFELINHGEHVYFDSAAMLMFFLLIGRYLDFLVRRNAKSAASDLLQSFNGFATVIEDGKTSKYLISDLREDMHVLVAAGETIPADGTLIEGKSSIDTSLITGETLPRPIHTGDKVHSGTLNISAPITVKVDAAAEDSLLADIVRLMEKAEQGQAKYVRIADKAARLYTPVVHSLALIAFLLWWGLLGAQWQDALLIAVTVLIITCPCALGLAVPVVQVIAGKILMKAGVLVKSGDALERLAEVDTVIFDKTGTLTIGKPALAGEYDAEHLGIAASLAQHSTHPLSQALLKNYKGPFVNVSEIEDAPGQGLSATINNQHVRLGSRKWCNVPEPDADVSLSEVCLSIDGQQIETFRFEDQIRPDARETLDAMKQSGMEFLLLSGDNQGAVKQAAELLDITHYKAQLSPIDKAEHLEKLKEGGHKILMVGDGLNDAPVLSAADVSIAPGSAVDMAQNAADIIFMGESLSPVQRTYKIARNVQTLVKENFALAIIYNCVAIPLAFCGFVTPLIAALAMSGSSLLVVANSYRLTLKS